MGNETTAKDTKTDSLAGLIELNRIDTLYGDLYLRRAKELLHGTMPLETYRGLLRMETELSNLPNRIHNAMMQGNWAAVSEMSTQMQSMKQTSEQDAAILNLAKTLYEQEAIPIDPFSSGMQSLAGKSVKDLPALRDKALHLLVSLMKIDGEWRDFYNKRHNDLQTETVISEVVSSTTVATRASPEKLRQEAQDALEKGDFDKLRQLAGMLTEGDKGEPAAGFIPRSEGKPAAAKQRFDFIFPEEVLERARNWGLAPFRVDSRYEEYVQIAPFIWHPTYADLETEHGRALRLSALPLPADTPEALRTRIEMFVLHPFINSAGIRFLPPLVDEDVLAEDFDEPVAGSAMPVSPLLEALKLNRRNSMTRMQIESALAEYGYLFVKERLGLDPYEFRLVCIPPDLHLRIGMGRGWGNQPIWTHFDGYMLTADGKMHALAGGDVRFGGIYDMVGISRNYEADRIIARFAVVQRRRMARPQNG